jgi:hypothetical protein
MRKKVEIFLKPPACACTGAITSLAEQEKYSRAELLLDILEDHPDKVETQAYYLVDGSSYGEVLKLLASYLRDAGEEEFADRVAFSIKYVTPSIAIDGKLKYIGEAPDIDKFLDEIGLKNA